MISAQKMSEIKKNLKKGYPQGEMINDLIKEGYEPGEINDALFQIQGSKPGSDAREFPLWYMASICFIILGIAILSVPGLWIYFFGYVFLIVGVVGVAIKFLVIDNGKNHDNPPGA